MSAKVLENIESKRMLKIAEYFFNDFKSGA